MQSESINELAKALCAAQTEFTAIPKDSSNPFFKSKYAGLPVVIAVASPILNKHGLSISQHISVEGDNDTMTTYLLHESGQYIAHAMRLHLVKSDPQGQGSAVTYARRYSYMSVLGLVADDDDDGNAGSGMPTIKPKHADPAPHIEQARSTVAANKQAPPAGKINALEDSRWATIAEGAKHPGASEMLTDIHGKGEKFKFLSEKQVAAAFAAATKLTQAPQSGTMNKIADAFPGSHDERPF